ncbi:MAG: translocation protein TolB [Bdellovibrionota bacterium]
MRIHPILSALALLISVSFVSSSFAGQIYIPVGKARIKKSVLAFPDTKYLSAGVDSGDSKGLARTVKEVVTSDLNFVNLFTLQSADAFIEKSDAGLTLEGFKMSDWTTIGTEFLIKTGITITGDSVAYEMRLYDVLGGKQILGKRYVAKTNEPRVLAHSVANDIIESLTGKPGIFFTKIAMVCDKTGQKEIWLTDFDGSNPRQLTSHRTLAFAPAWSPDNRKIAYSLFTKNKKNVKNTDLYEYSFVSRRSRLLSNRKGINSGAAYSPDGKSIALTMSFLGNPEIFSLNPVSLEATRLTKSFGFDVDPAWSPDGSELTFVSTRSNQPMIYRAPVAELKQNPAKATRVTFTGRYNATPSWSPTDKKIAYATDLGSNFDLMVVNADGSGQIDRLTMNEGSNEDPHFSPDGNFLVFTSSRTGQKNIYIISIDGTYTKRLTFGLGNCVSPKWSFSSKEAF